MYVYEPLTGVSKSVPLWNATFRYTDGAALYREKILNIDGYNMLTADLNKSAY